MFDAQSNCSVQARGETSGAAAGDSLSPAVVKHKLRKLITKLDSVLPYLTLAISAVHLLSSGWRGWGGLVF